MSGEEHPQLPPPVVADEFIDGFTKVGVEPTELDGPGEHRSGPGLEVDLQIRVIFGGDNGD